MESRTEITDANGDRSAQSRTENPDGRADRSAPEQASSDYWRAMDGALYEEMIREREGNTNANYQQQEAFLTKFVRGEHERLGRPVRVLEFGCGFGRHARYLADMEGVEYFGYDFSEKMIEPLRVRPPRGLEPIAERLFSGPDVKVALDARKFDLVFTVSVFIHNAPAKIPGLLADLARLLAPGGLICLIENRLVPISVFENTWHQGCWLQSYTEHVRRDFDLQIGQGLLDAHDVYLLRPNGGRPTTYARLDGTPLGESELAAMSAPKIRAWAESVQRLIARGNGAVAETRLFEVEELLRAEQRRAALQRSLATLADHLASLRRERAHEAGPAHRASRVEPAPGVRPAVLWDEPADTRWAQRDERFTRVLHVFHQNWHGIRASAGYAPGHKLAIAGGRLLTASEHADILQGISDRLIKSVVFHSYSKALDEVAGMLRKARGGALALYAVWHGNTAQFHVDDEYELFDLLLLRRARGALDGVACVKADMHLLSAQIFPKTLLCLPPFVEGPVEVRAALSGIAFIPVPNDWRKNFYTNLLATRLIPRLREVLVTTEFRLSADWKGSRVVRLAPPERTQMFRFLRQADVILNATLSECQPMTALEGLALGTPCLTGPLGLGELDGHPYQRLVQVPVVDSIREVRDAIDAVLDLREKSPGELRGMMSDYSRTLTTEAIARYREFLRL